MTTTTTPQTLEREPGKGIHVQLALDVDDAFADGDDQPLEFSPAAIRQHLAEQANWTTADQPTDTSSVDEPDTSISTLHLDGSTYGSTSDSPSVGSCVSQFHTPVDQEPSYDLSNISLSEPEKQVDHYPNVLHEQEDDAEEPSHPAVHIDVSKPPSRRVSVITPTGDSATVSDGTQCISASSSVLDLPTMATSSSLPNTQVSLPPPQSHKPSWSSGPTTFQKVVSRTRPIFLPPKSRKEDKKHLADWEAMMKQSRAAGDMVQPATTSLC